jgi:hypothetical protein
LAADAPSQVRYRALLAASDRVATVASPAPGSRAPLPGASLKRLARDEAAPRAARLGALLALGRLSPKLARSLAAELRDDPDSTVAHWARR